MNKIEKIALDLIQKVGHSSQNKDLTAEMISGLNLIVKEAMKADFRLNRTLRDKDISNSVLRNTIRELEKQNEIVEKQSRFKEELFASISHELRTPLHGILGMSQLIARTEMSEKQTEFINVINGSANNLLVIINDILSLTQMNAGKAEIVEKPFYLANLINEVDGALKLKAEAKNLFFRIDIDPNLPESIIGDQTRIYQVLINLLNNSIKFTDKGWILLKIENLVQRNVEVDLLITVEDTGIGIEKEKQAKIFEPFSRVHDLKGAVIEGAGLGLNIVKNLVNLLDGEIKVESEFGRGTRFELRFSFKISACDMEEIVIQPTERLEIPKEWQDYNILLIEDNPANILYAKHLFLEWNMEIDVAEDCATSRIKLKENKYDCILSDVKLPDGNGIDLIREIRENFNSPNYQTPVLILTASASEHEKIITEAINIQSYMSKPFRPTLLIKEMKKALNNRPETEWKPSFSVPDQSKQVVYFSSLYKKFGKNLSVVKEMLGIFKTQIPVTLEKLEQYLKDENYEGFYFEIHRIKSTINIVGLPVLVDLAMIMERDSYDATNVSAIPEYFKQFKKQAAEDMKIIEAELEKLSQSVV